jgi:hypothetical protein
MGVLVCIPLCESGGTSSILVYTPNMFTNEYDSQDGEVYRGLKTAKDLNLADRPCDICEGTDSPVRFWGGTSVLVCNKLDCLLVMEERWNESMNQCNDENIDWEIMPY